MTREAFIGFDSAWGDKNLGSIAWASFSDLRLERCCLPKLASFNETISVCKKLRACHDFLLIGMDQPTIVENYSGMRPVEKVVGSLIGRLKSGVQPANCKRKEFGPNAPFRRFLNEIDVLQDPMTARVSQEGAYLVEVYPGLALTALEPEIMEREQAARYNPKKRNFRVDDWKLVAKAVARHTDHFNLPALSKWAKLAADTRWPSKGEQDMLDAVICLIVALQWRRAERESVAMIGDLDSGYMITPVSKSTKAVLQNSARERGVSYQDAANADM